MPAKRAAQGRFIAPPSRYSDLHITRVWQMMRLRKGTSCRPSQSRPGVRSMKIKLSQFVIATISTILLAGAAQAGDASGTWLRENGESKVKIAPCGEALCGSVVWVKDPKHQDNVGKRVFYDMAPSGDDKWKGKAFNPEDGKTYTGTMTLSGNRLTTAGCVLGGLICRSVSWNRQ
ncbi:DUF2147 domain-containing protein [Labrys portucalensis]|uniref:DUF2147 domain-containing protein n=2 Tax=Labrys neptuniae TaxID=376174 RepID=A0ABV6Z9S7_9HYPH